MSLAPRRWAARFGALALSVPAALVPAALVPATASPATERPVTVMTRNVYIGADIQRPIKAAYGLTGDAAVLALAHGTDTTRQIVDHTDFAVRSELLAEEIADAHPDLVGLQEVALWRSGPLETDPAMIGVPNATHVDYDYLAMLLQDLRKEGVPYKAVMVQQESDVESPSFAGLPGTASFARPRDVRLTVDDVVLLRASSTLRVVDRGGAHYTHNLAVTVAAKDMVFARGYAWVDLLRGTGDRLRFVTTHLEAFSSDIALAQAAELLAATTSQGRATVLACDCNSDPLDSSIKPLDHVPHKAPYDLITGRGGFSDMWLRWRPAVEGWTSGLDETVDDAGDANHDGLDDRFDHRIDMIFVRTAGGPLPDVVGGAVTGNELADRDPASGLWPSDHAGVELALRGI